MTAQDYDRQRSFPEDDLNQLPLAQLVALAHAAADSVSRRLISIRSLDDLSPVIDRPRGSAADWGAMMHADRDVANRRGSTLSESAAVRGDPSGGTGCPAGDGATGHAFTLPVLHHALEGMARSITAAQMSLAGHTLSVFDLPADRTRLLGLPGGKTAFRDTADYLRAMLHIDITEAKQRLRHAATLGESRTMTGETLPARLPHLAEAVQQGLLDRSTIEHISNAMAEARRIANNAGMNAEAADQLISQGERLMVDQGQAMDPRSLRQVCHHWLKRFEAIVDPDGNEPTDLDAPRLQGMMYKGHRNGFHQWRLAANDAQHEVLKTIASAATNPRTRHDSEVRTDDALLTAESPDGCATPAIDPRTGHQQQLDGLIACLSGGLSLADSNTLPWTGGMRPQVAVTIDYRTLLGDLVDAGTATVEHLAHFQSTAAFTGAVHPQNIRALACDADILPVVLGSDGQVLDVGRSQRLFPTRLRQAIAARDGGCTAPGCGIPAPWCDVHHVEHWEHGGVTSADNGVLLCNHHHHAVHAGAWDIDITSGRPWFIPAPYVDPMQRRQRNRYWRQ